MTATIPILSSKTVNAHFDTQTGVLFVSYYGVLDASTSGNLYQWIEQMKDVVDSHGVRGLVFDLRKVVRFKRDNLYTAAEQSQRLSEQLDHRIYPIALIVGNYYQEQMAKVTLLVTHDSERREIVRSMEEALTYIGSWYARN
ncbi:MAG: hypothetical protein EA396_05280 [Anaerolineaceae bacterium]|nr:MAG: hypothetical protein EA396_05280 [Anaerolineaceae bacterium]